MTTSDDDEQDPRLFPGPPRFLSRSFNCAHCGAIAQQEWLALGGHPWHDATRTYRSSDFAASICGACQEWAIWRSEPRGWNAKLLWPVPKPVDRPVHKDMPPQVRKLYEEAADVEPVSSRAAAALLRLALESLLKGLYPDERDLNHMIGAAVRDGIPEPVQKAMDALRFNGNQAVHELRLDDTAAAAESMFKLVNFVVERLITEPRHVDELYAALPEKTLDGIAKRDRSGGVEA